MQYLTASPLPLLRVIRLILNVLFGFDTKFLEKVHYLFEIFVQLGRIIIAFVSNYYLPETLIN
jgi:hypothetical protein